MMETGLILDDAVLSESQQLQVAERGNGIYRQQLKYMQDHLAFIRLAIEDRDNIIENLMLRYDLGILGEDSNRTNMNLGADEIDLEELRRKTEAFAQRTILENFELRELVNEWRDENFHVMNDIYELRDKIRRQTSKINWLDTQIHLTKILIWEWINSLCIEVNIPQDIKHKIRQFVNIIYCNGEYDYKTQKRVDIDCTNEKKIELCQSNDMIIYETTPKLSQAYEFSETERLQLAETANEMYRQVLKCMQNRLASLRSLMPEKKNIMQNFMLRYDLGIITTDRNRAAYELTPTEIEMEELTRKAEGLAHRSILENFELREMVAELEDRNHHLRNELFELQYQVDLKATQIHKLDPFAADNSVFDNDWIFNDDIQDDNNIYEIEADEQMDDDHIYNDNALLGTVINDMDNPANSKQAIAKRVERQAKCEREESVKPPDLFGNSSDSDTELILVD